MRARRAAEGCRAGQPRVQALTDGVLLRHDYPSSNSFFRSVSARRSRRFMVLSDMPSARRPRQGELLIIAQQHSLPAGQGQAEHGAGKRVLLRGAGGGGLGQSIEGDAAILVAKPALALQIAADVDGDMGEPGFLAAVAAKVWQRAPCADEGILHGVLRQRGVAQQRAAQAQQRRFILRHGVFQPQLPGDGGLHGIPPFIHIDGAARQIVSGGRKKEGGTRDVSFLMHESTVHSVPRSPSPHTKTGGEAPRRQRLQLRVEIAFFLFVRVDVLQLQLVKVHRFQKMLGQKVRQAKLLPVAFVPGQDDRRLISSPWQISSSACCQVS